MSAASLVSRHSLATLVRNGSVLLLVAFFALMVLVTAWLGWSATATVNAIYANAAQFLTAAGRAVPPNPVSESAPLTVMRNLGVYISLVGAFSAIVIGQMLIETDRHAGTLPLIGAKPLQRRALAWGKMQALMFATGSMMAVAAIICSATLLAIPSLSVGPGDIINLAIFLLAGWAYITAFGFLSLGAAARLPATASGLIAATVVWLVITFVLPELTANIHPTAAINPISTLAATPNTPVFKLLSGVLGPFSIAEGFAWLNGHLMSFLPYALTPRGPIQPAVTIPIALALTAAFAPRSVAPIDLKAGGPAA